MIFAVFVLGIGVLIIAVVVCLVVNSVSIGRVTNAIERIAEHRCTGCSSQHK